MNTKKIQGQILFAKKKKVERRRTHCTHSILTSAAVVDGNDLNNVAVNRVKSHWNFKFRAYEKNTNHNHLKYKKKLTCWIISTVFQPLQASDQQFQNFFTTLWCQVVNISENSCNKKNLKIRFIILRRARASVHKL